MFANLDYLFANILTIICATWTNFCETPANLGAKFSGLFAKDRQHLTNLKFRQTRVNSLMRKFPAMTKKMYA